MDYAEYLKLFLGHQIETGKTYVVCRLATQKLVEKKKFEQTKKRECAFILPFFF